MRNPYREPLFYSKIERCDDRVVSIYGFNHYTWFVHLGLWIHRMLKKLATLFAELSEKYSDWWFTDGLTWVLEH